jgi:hypothetical protein
MTARCTKANAGDATGSQSGEQAKPAGCGGGPAIHGTLRVNTRAAGSLAWCATPPGAAFLSTKTLANYVSAVILKLGAADRSDSNSPALTAPLLWVALRRSGPSDQRCFWRSLI